MAVGDAPPKVTMALTDSSRIKPVASRYRRRGNQCPVPASQVSIKGATVTAPVKSPNHQVSHNSGNCDHCAECKSVRLRLPIVAANIVQTTVAQTNLKTSRARSSEFRKLNARSKLAAPTASSVFPIEITRVAVSGMGVVRLTSNAPRNTPGQTRTPNKRTAARAMPVGGQIGETLVWTEARVSPNLPATK